MLFGLKKFEFFLLMFGVRRVMNELYLHEEDEEKVSKVLLQKLEKENIKRIRSRACSGRYLFYQRRQRIVELKQGGKSMKLNLITRQSRKWKRAHFFFNKVKKIIHNEEKIYIITHQNSFLLLLKKMY